MIGDQRQANQARAKYDKGKGVERDEGSSLTKHRYLGLYADGKVTMDEMADLFEGFAGRQDRKYYDQMTKGERAIAFFVKLLGGQVGYAERRK
jgi:hypothetical protein